MSTKTISLRAEAYERLRRARLRPGEPFSDVVLRARWPDVGLTARELLEWHDREGPFFTEAALDRVESAKAADAPPADKWKKRR